MQYIGNKGWFEKQPTPITKAATATLTIAELLAEIIVTSGTVAISLTLPTGTLSESGITLPNLSIDGCFDWCIINTGTSTGAITLVAGTAHTIVGAAVTAIGTSSQWRTRKTAANTFVTYRIA